MASTDDWGGVAVDAQPKPDDWGGVPVTEPKMPDMSGVQKIAQQNLAAPANDNATDTDKVAPAPTPMQKLNTATGLPIDSIIAGNAKNVVVPPEQRVAYSTAAQAGTVSDSSDWVQNLVHAVTPFLTPDPNGFLANVGKNETAFLKDMLNPSGAPMNMTPEEYRKYAESQPKQGYLAQLGEDTSLLSGAFTLPFSPFMAAGGAAGQEIYKQAYEPEDLAQMSPEERERGENVANAAGQAVAGVAAAAMPLLHPPIHDNVFPPSRSSTEPPKTSEPTIIDGEYTSSETKALPVWDNRPGSEDLHEPVGKAVGKEPNAVTSADIDQTLADGAKDIFPHPNDFKNVATALGAEPKIIHTIYEETGVKPAQVFEDARFDPQIATDAADGRVPDAYAHLAEPKPETPSEQLRVSRDDNSKVFNVVDKDGDHVQGGFDSYEEAKQYVEDKKAGQIPDEPPEWANKQDVLTPEDAEKTNQPKAKESIYKDIDDKIATMTPEQASTRLGSLNKKNEAGISTTREMYEREALADGQQSVITGAERISDRELAERKMEGAKQSSVPQKAADEGLFDVSARGQGDIFDQPVKEIESKPLPSKNTIPPSSTGKPTSLRTFLSNNGARFNEDNEIQSIKRNGVIIKGEAALEHANEIAKEHGYLPHDQADRLSESPLANKLTETNGGHEAWRDADAQRLQKINENAEAKKWQDPSYLEHEAHNTGLDTERLKDETDKQYIKRLTKALTDFYKNTEGAISPGAYRKVVGDSIIAAEKFVGKLTGNLFEKLADGYVKTFQPELMGDKALRLDAYLAKFKASKQEAQNSYFIQSKAEIKRVDKETLNQQKEWLYDHETGRWDREENPDHARMEAMYNVVREAEKKAGVASDGFKENYLPHQYEKPDEVSKFFRSDTMIKKYGNDWFNKVSEFKLVQEADRAGFELKTYNREKMLVARQTASHSLIAHMDLLKDMESSDIATPARAFTADKRIAKMQASIADAEAKYKAASDKINDPNQAKWDFADPAVSKYMKGIEARIEKMKGQFDGLNKEKEGYKLAPEQYKDLKDNGFKIIGPDSKVWNIHNDGAPLWKNAMEMKGLWEREGAAGDAFRYYSQAKNIYTDIKLSLSLFHPLHEALINTSSAIAAPIHHLIQGGKFSDLAWKDAIDALPVGDGRGISAYKTAPDLRTPEQKADVARMIEGGFVPTESAQDLIHFKDNWDKAISGVGLNNLRLIGTALQLPGKAFEPLFSKWIPRLRSNMYFSLTDKALARDPSLSQDAGRRGMAFRAIAKDIDRTYGQLNQDTLFWNKNVKDAFNAAYISGGWKLAQIYNARGLLQPANIAYKFAKTGEFSRADITYNMLQAYAYTGITLAFGAAVNKMLGNPIGKTLDEAKTIGNYVWDIVKDCQFIKVGNNPDGTPLRVSQPSFMKEWFMEARDINEKGLIAGSGKFIYNGTLIPGISDFLGFAGDGLSDAITGTPNPIGQDGLKRSIISNPLDLHQWMNAGLDFINPITVSSFERADEKGSTQAKLWGLAGLPIAGAYVDQSPFEQKVLDLYHEQNPSKDDVYTAKLKANLRSAVAKGDIKSEEKTEKQMEAEGMTDRQISNTKKEYADKFIDYAWKRLSAQDQQRLIKSASDEEKKNFEVKGQ